ncbi:glycosyltransferase family 15 protein [Russula compacta]|nr:glycosyltransferase family 15 protein [Russula compacta]
MSPPTRISRPILIIVFVILALLSLSLITPHPYNPVNSISSLISPQKSPHNAVPAIYYDDLGAYDRVDPNVGEHPPGSALRRPANATLLMLARNSDVDGAVRSIREMEDRFNHKYHYPWVFLNEQPFSNDFKLRVSVLASGPVHFGLIPEDHWYQPSWINETKAKEERDKMAEEGVIYGGSLPYRNMCRFNSGFFYRHPLLQDFRYYWRVEPGVHFHCDVNFDPFVYMHENNKTYGFTVTMYEFRRTIESLWSTVNDFITEHPEYVAQNSAMKFLSDNGGADYNLCHFWSNFEIADLDFWRGEAYTAFFDHLDRRGGFYYERWGDAPVHSIAAALFAGTDRIQFFREIGYEHAPYTHCPAEEELWKRGRCTCDPVHSFDYDGYSCMPRWDRTVGRRW